jgi:hypothetical protein
MAQSNVYSLNVVGYVNVVFPSGQFTVFVNPLNNTNNSIANVFPASAVADGSFLYDWNSGANDWNSPVTFNNPPGAWDAPATQITPGHGFAFFNADFGSDRTNTFVGEVIQGPFTNALNGNFQFNVVGSSAPIGGNFTNSVAGVPVDDGDFLYTWNSGLNDWNSPNTFNNPPGAWDSPGYQIPVAMGFALFKSGANANWVRNFTVQ